MKNNKNYCKFVSQVKSSQVKSSQVKSSQVKSSAKIVFLINNSFKIFLIALFILLFSISCKPKQNPNEGGSHSRAELTGKWKMYENTDRVQTTFTVDDNGNINFPCGGLFSGLGTDLYFYSGKISDTFNYPYTTKLTATYRETTVEGIITFDNQSSATIYYSYYYGGSGWNKATSTFTIREALD